MPSHFTTSSLPALGSALQSLSLACVLGAGLFAVAAEAADAAPIVAVTGGQIRGKLLPESRGAVFKGIPFAQPPVGPLRWREPQPVLAWDGIRDAFVSGPPAAQASLGWNDAFAAASREDCLYLDVWTPTVVPDPVRKPVMVWIHGGANLAGTGGFDPLYDGRALIRRDVVLVVVEYRVGIFGFFAHPELTKESPHHSSGNYAFLDQIAALQWVRDNIAKFGGDPGNVTLFGQSAGAIDLTALMTSPLARGLFHRAIAESGPLIRQQTQPLGAVEAAGVRTAGELRAPERNTLAYLRSLPAEKLLQVKSAGVAFGVDGWVFPANPVDVFQAGKAHPLPLLSGSNAIEFPFAGSPAAMEKNIREILQGLAAKGLALYGPAGTAARPAVDPKYGDQADQWGSDLFRCPVIIQGELHGAAGNSVWEYEFTRAIPPRPKVGHGSDLPYVFGNLYPTGGQGGEFQAADRKLSDIVQTYWTNFAKTGNPNGAGLPLWPQYDGKARKFLEFTANAEVAVGENQRGPYCDLFRELMKKSAATQ